MMPVMMILIIITTIKSTTPPPSALPAEGWECQAILGGTGFLGSHFAPYVFMEWAVVSNNRHKYHAPCRPAHLQRMVQWFASRGYHAHISKSGVELNPARLETWRAGDIYWRHRTAPRLQHV